MSAQGRPVGVTVVGVLIVVSGFFGIIGGLLGIFDPLAREGLGLFRLILVLVLGVIYLAVAKGIFNGNNFSRFVVGIVTVINLIAGLFALLFLSGSRVNGLIQLIFAIVILALLYNRRASAFFASR
jgi:hypothetical protein